MTNASSMAQCTAFLASTMPSAAPTEPMASTQKAIDWVVAAAPAASTTG